MGTGSRWRRTVGDPGVGMKNKTGIVFINSVVIIVSNLYTALFRDSDRFFLFSAFWAVFRIAENGIVLIDAGF